MGFSAGAMATAALGAQAAGGAMQTVGAYYGARSQRSLLNLQADIGDINARMAEESARGALLAGQREEQAVRLRTAQAKGSQRASLAARGVDLGVGSAAEALTTTDVAGEWDANTTAANALRTAWGYRMQGVDASNQAVMQRAGASAVSPTMAGASTLLGQAGTVAASWYRFNQAGAWGRKGG